MDNMTFDFKVNLPFSFCWFECNIPYPKIVSNYHLNNKSKNLNMFLYAISRD